MSNPILPNNNSYSAMEMQDSSVTGRVEYVILTNEAHTFKGVKIPFGSLGCILFSMVSNAPYKVNSNYYLAYPKSNNRRYPIEFELVPITTDASKDAQNPKGTIVSNYYYGDPLPVYNAVNHNATPSEVVLQTGASPVGNDFKEKQGLKPIQPLPGCTIIEGRFGNSIRMGSSNTKFNSPWKGEDGEPVTIIVNSKREILDRSVTSIYEDVNTDSGIFMLSKQTINFNPSSTNFNTYSQTISTEKRNNYITTKEPDKPATNPAETLLQDDRKATENVTDTGVQNIQLNVQPPPQNITAEEELESIPDSEGDFVQIFDSEIYPSRFDVASDVLLKSADYNTTTSILPPLGNVENLIKQIFSDLPKPFVRLVIAQTSFETAFGEKAYSSPVFKRTNNIGGYKYVRGNRYQLEPDNRIAPEGDRYAKYRTVEDAVRDMHRHFKKRPKYLYFTTPEEYVTQLQKDGYFTSGYSEYLNGVKVFFNRIKM